MAKYGIYNGRFTCCSIDVEVGVGRRQSLEKLQYHADLTGSLARIVSLWLVGIYV